MIEDDKNSYALTSATKIQKPYNNLRCTRFYLDKMLILGGILFLLISVGADASELTESSQVSKIGEINEHTFSEKMSDSQKNQIQEVCNRKDIMPSNECLQLVQKLSAGCNGKIPPSCYRHILNEDLAGYIEGKDSLLGSLNSSAKIKLPNELNKLEKISIFEKEKLPQGCLDSIKQSEICGMSFSYKMLTDIDSWANGKPSTIGELVNEKINLLSEFQSTEGYGKKTKWGMSKKQVEKIYPSVDNNGKNILLLAKQVTGRDGLIEFFFGEDKLTTVTILFQEAYSSFNPEEAVEDYEDISLLLTKKYGEYKNENMESKNVVDAIYEGVGGTGRSVRSGRKTLLRKWNTGKTQIEHCLKGENSSFKHKIIYKSNELIGLAKENLDKKNLDDL